MRYKPSAPVMVVVFIPVAVFTASTVALGSAAPLGSTTVPTRFPSIVCAKTRGTELTRQSTIRAVSIEFLIEDILTLLRLGLRERLVHAALMGKKNGERSYPDCREGKTSSGFGRAPCAPLSFTPLPGSRVQALGPLVRYSAYARRKSTICC